MTRTPVQIVQGFIDCQLEAGNSAKHQLLCNVRDKIKEECMTNSELNLNCTNCGEYAGSDIADEIERLREALLVAEVVMRAAFADPESLIYSELSTNCFVSAMEIVTAALKGQDQ